MLSNDTFAASRATTGVVRLRQVSSTNRDLQLDVTDGSIDVLRKTASGANSVVYEICEIASPTNCDRATVTVNLSGK